MSKFSPFDATLWYATAAPAPHTVPLAGRVQADVCIVGAGYTGLTTALELRRRARRLGFGVMIGSMVGTSLGVAPALVLAQGADFVDLDGPLLLAADRSPGLVHDGSVILPPEPALWG